MRCVDAFTWLQRMICMLAHLDCLVENLLAGLRRVVEKAQKERREDELEAHHGQQACSANELDETLAADFAERQLVPRKKSVNSHSRPNDNEANAQHNASFEREC